MSEKVCKEVGNYIGRFIKSDTSNFGGLWRNYLRIRVFIDVRKPLKRKMKIKKAGGEWLWIYFKYERLPLFCFFCGIIGHGEKFCERFFDCQNKPTEMPYGVWIRAPSRREMHQIGERWLRSTAPVTETTGNTHATFDDMSLDKESPLNQPKGKGIVSNFEIINGGSVGDTIIRRDLRINSNIGAETYANDGQQEGVIILDQKRCRIAELKEHVIDNQGGLDESVIEESQESSKNTGMAGSAFQACQET